MPRNAGLVLDTAAVIAYTNGSELVGREISATADEGLKVVVPAACFATAYQRVTSDGWGLLDILGTLPQVVVAPLEHDMCAVLGGWARTLGLDLAQAPPLVERDDRASPDDHVSGRSSRSAAR